VAGPLVEEGALAPVSKPADRTRPVCFDADDGYVDTPVLWRADLAPRTVVEGPAILEEFGSTVPLHPGFTARIDDYRNVIVERSAR
jgi:N-methylhydantoinase A